MTNPTLFSFCENLKYFLSDSVRRFFMLFKCEAFLVIKKEKRLDKDV